MKALRRFGAPLSDISESDFSTEGIIFQIGNSRGASILLPASASVDFERAYANRKSVPLEGIDVPVISLEDLIANKRASARAQDLADLERLEKLVGAQGILKGA